MNTRPELELLLACARARDHATHVARLVGAPLDWDYFTRLAARQGLLPLAYRRLRDADPALIPAEPLGRLKQEYARAAAHSLFLTGELCRTLDAFERAGVEAIPYKGPALAVAAYGDATLRQFVDLDILVRPRDVKRASDLLAASGFTPHFRLRNEREEETFLRLSYVQLFRRERDGLAVELHWNVAPRFFNFPLRVERLWEHEGRIEVGGRQVRALAPEMLALLLCVHGNKDYWLRLEWVAAVAAVVAREEGFDWPLLVGEAERHRAMRVVLLGLSLARDLLGADLPAQVSRLLESTPAVPALAETAHRAMFADAPRAPTLREQLRFHTRSKDAVRDRAAYCARLALTTTPVDWGTLDLPASLSFVHALARPFRLARKYLFAHARRA